MADARAESGFSASHVLHQGLEAIKANPALVLGFTFAVAVLPQLVASIAVMLVAPGAMPSVQAPFTLASSLLSLVGVLMAVAAQGGLFHYYFGFAKGQPVSAGDMATASLRLMFPFLLLSIVAWLAIFIGFALLFVPGLILAVMWVATPGVIVAERTGVFASFGRSRALTKGVRWKILGLVLVITIIIWVLTATVSFGIMGAAGFAAAMTPGLSASKLFTLLLNAIVSGLGQAWWGTTQAALYQELVEWKEGPDTDDLAEIFA